MNNFLSTKQSVRILRVQENIQSKLGTPTCPEKTCHRAYGDFAPDFTNPGLIYARFLHFVPNKYQNMMKLSCNCRIIWWRSRKRELSRAVPQSSKGRLSCIMAPRGQGSIGSQPLSETSPRKMVSGLVVLQDWCLCFIRYRRFQHSELPLLLWLSASNPSGGQLCKHMTKREKATSSS